MKLSTYIITVDTGFSPNPFGRHCTLACCKPTIRRNAKTDDVVAAIASVRYPHEGKLVYALRVKEILTFDQYWKDRRFAYKKPKQHTSITKRGDNIWFRKNGRWHVVPNAMHGMEQRKRDISGENVLISTDFYYFGSNAISVPRRFCNLLATTQGHKNCRDEEKVGEFWEWVCSQAERRGRLGDPSDFDDSGCSAQRSEKEAEDLEEC